MLRCEHEKLIVEENRFRLDESNRLRLEEENMLQLEEQKKKKRKEFMNSSHSKNIFAKLAPAKRNQLGSSSEKINFKLLLQKGLFLFYANGERYTAPWSEVDQLHPQIHQMHWTDPGDGGFVGHTSCSPMTDLNFKRSDDEEYAMAVRNFKKFFRKKGKFVWQPREEKKSLRQRDEKKGKSDQKCSRCGDPSHLIGDCPKRSRNKDQKAFIGGSWSDSENDAKDKTNDETCLMAQSSNEVLTIVIIHLLLIMIICKLNTIAYVKVA
nr:phospholipase-like, aminotransferase-like mobile domain protein [Tanacetum cinerariifolium]